MARTYAWALAHPGAIKDAEPEIARALYTTLRVTDPARRDVHVSGSSGWIAYYDRTQLWQKYAPDRLPARAADARERAEQFLRDFARALTGDAVRRAPTLANLSLFPPQLEPLEVVLVPCRDASGFDHWLYRAQPQLTLSPDERRAVAILGSQIEIRVGNQGQIISFRSRYRPVTGERVTAELTPLDPEDFEPEHGHDDDHEPKSSIVYVLEGDGLPQHYVSPYHLVNDGHELRLASASPWSLTIALGLVQDDETTCATAVVSGGSGDYAFDWGMYPLDNVEEGYRGLGPGRGGETKDRAGRRITTSAVDLPIGAHVVLVNVKDRQTGAFKHHQQSVFSGPVISSERGPQVVA